MVVTGLLEGCYEPLADADVHIGPVTNRLVVVELDFAGLRFERKLIRGKARGLVELVGAKIHTNTGCRAEDDLPVTSEAAASSARARMHPWRPRMFPTCSRKE